MIQKPRVDIKLGVCLEPQPLEKILPGSLFSLETHEDVFLLMGPDRSDNSIVGASQEDGQVYYFKPYLPAYLVVPPKGVQLVYGRPVDVHPVSFDTSPHVHSSDLGDIKESRKRRYSSDPNSVRRYTSGYNDDFGFSMDTD